jgi:hypothetical protein
MLSLCRSNVQVVLVTSWNGGAIAGASRLIKSSTVASPKLRVTQVHLMLQVHLGGLAQAPCGPRHRWGEPGKHATNHKMAVCNLHIIAVISPV